MPGPAPTAPFNRYPVGLLGLLDAKVQGKTPNELAQYTYPVLELAAFLLEQGQESLNDLTANIGAVGRFFGTNGNLVVPDNEIWWVHSVSARPNAALAAGTTYTVVPVHETALALGPSIQCLYPRAEPQTGTVGQQPFSGNSTPFLCSPGDRLGAYFAQAVIGTAIPCQIFAKITRLRV